MFFSTYMFKKIVLIYLGLSLLACSGNEKFAPDDVLPVGKMSEVMLDIHLLEAQMNLTSFTTNNPSVINTKPMLDVFKKHGVKPEEYRRSINYYTTQSLDSLNRIYELVLIDLSKMQAEVNNKKASSNSQK
jgi:hypothetical protein